MICGFGVGELFGFVLGIAILLTNRNIISKKIN